MNELRIFLQNVYNILFIMSIVSSVRTNTGINHIIIHRKVPCERCSVIISQIKCEIHATCKYFWGYIICTLNQQRVYRDWICMPLWLNILARSRSRPTHNRIRISGQVKSRHSRVWPLVTWQYNLDQISLGVSLSESYIRQLYSDSFSQRGSNFSDSFGHVILI